MAGLFPERIETDRLVFEPLHEIDPIQFYDICSSDDGIEAVTEYLPWTPHDHPKETREFLDRCEQRWTDDEGAEYVIRPREGEDGAGEIAGATGLSIDWDAQVATLGMWLRKRFWGRGYSGERAAALMDVAFDHLDVEVLEVTHQVGNEKSQRAIESYIEAHGGRHEGLLRNYEPADLDTGGSVDARRYTVSREEFEQNRTIAPGY